MKPLGDIPEGTGAISRRLRPQADTSGLRAGDEFDPGGIVAHGWHPCRDAGIFSFHSHFRWCRYAQPPANGYEPFGFLDTLNHPFPVVSLRSTTG